MKILLTIAYLSAFGEASINTNEMTSMQECNQKAIEVHRNVRAGTARVWCTQIKYDSKPALIHRKEGVQSVLQSQRGTVHQFP